jgi:hypothetical protein
VLVAFLRDCAKLDGFRLAVRTYYHRLLRVKRWIVRAHRARALRIMLLGLQVLCIDCSITQAQTVTVTHDDVQLDTAVNAVRASAFTASLTEIPIAAQGRAIAALQQTISIVARLVKASGRSLTHTCIN